MADLAFLFVIVFIRFPAGLLGQHLDNQLAVALYGVSRMAANAMGTALWLYRRRARIWRSAS